MRLGRDFVHCSDKASLLVEWTPLIAAVAASAQCPPLSALMRWSTSPGAVVDSVLNVRDSFREFSLRYPLVIDLLQEPFSQIIKVHFRCLLDKDPSDKRNAVDNGCWWWWSIYHNL
jgi:hypothetical protein